MGDLQILNHILLLSNHSIFDLDLFLKVKQKSLVGLQLHLGVFQLEGQTWQRKSEAGGIMHGAIQGQIWAKAGQEELFLKKNRGNQGHRWVWLVHGP